MEIARPFFNQRLIEIDSRVEGSLKLEAGDVVRALVQKVAADSLVQLAIKGRIVLAEAMVNLHAGEELFLQVDRQENGRLYMRVVDAAAQDQLPEMALRGTLLKLGLGNDDLTVAMARKLISYNLPLTRDNVENLAKMSARMGSGDPGTLEAAAYVLSREGKISSPAQGRSFLEFLQSDRQQLTAELQTLWETVNETATRSSNKTDNYGSAVAANTEPGNEWASANATSGEKSPASTAEPPAMGQARPGTGPATPPASPRTSGEPANENRLSPSYQDLGQSGENPPLTRETPPATGQNTGLVRQAYPWLATEVVDTPRASAVKSQSAQVESSLNPTVVEQPPVISNSAPEGETSPMAGQSLSVDSEIARSPGPALNVDDTSPLSASASRMADPGLPGLEQDKMQTGGDNRSATVPSPPKAAEAGPASAVPPPAGEKKTINTPHPNRMSSGLDEQAGVGWNQSSRSADLRVKEFLQPLLEKMVLDLDREKPGGDQVRQLIKDQEMLLPAVKVAHELLNSSPSGQSHPLAPTLEHLDNELSGQLFYNRMEAAANRDQANIYLMLPVRWQGKTQMVELGISWKRERRRQVGDQDLLTINVGLQTVNLGPVIVHLRTARHQMGLGAYLENEEARQLMEGEMPNLLKAIGDMGYQVTYLGCQVADYRLHPGLKETENETLPPVTGLDIRV